MRELRLRANGLGFRLLAEGPEAGELVLLLHGFPEGAESWTPQIEALAAAGFHAVAPDLRGYGGTDAPEGQERYRLAELTEDAAALVHELGRERCHLAGHDWGALVGWALAARRPDLVRTWTALSVPHPTPLVEASRHDPDQQARSAYINLFRLPGKAEAVLLEDGARRLRRIYGGALPEPLVDAYVRGQSRPGRLTAALSYYRANLSEQAWSAFPPMPGPVSAPTLLIWGDQDPALGRRAVEATAGHVAGPYRLEVLEGAGHWLQFEAAEAVSRLLVGHVSSE